MSNKLPPLKPLKAFEATVRAGSVTAAAAELNVTHSAISHQIKTLETALGYKLFERGAKRLKLTPEGAMLVPAVTDAFNGITEALNRVNQQTTSGQLSVSCAPALLSFWLMPRIHLFIEQYPDIKLIFNSSVDNSMVFDPNTDLCILYGETPRLDCWTSLWTQFDLFPVASATYLNRHTLKTFKNLKDQIMLHADDGREWHTWLGTAGAHAHTSDQQHYMGDARGAIDAALLGLGVALGDTLTASNLLSKGDLVMPFDLAVPSTGAFYLACRNEMRTTSIVSVFIDWLFAMLEQDPPATSRASSTRRIPQIRRKI
ncbi:MAG: LysR family transcriptional regulator [Sneathiella sp.]|nr:LysR family transcriptional regulator [Sneathiella sp.]